MAKTDNMVLLAIWVLVAIAAANWLLIGLNDTNLLAEVLPADLLDLVYIAAGLAGILDLLETFEIVDYPTT
jgi:uncharacterized membrane protein YuzA (DUF378 family)